MSQGIPIAKTRLGRTKLEVTNICFGTSAIGDMPVTYGYSVGEDRAKATVRAIFDGPVNIIDTSRNYGAGRAEQRIGDVIRERGGLPAGLVVSTKLDRDFETGKFDTARARKSLEESLKALGIDRIDLLHLHDPEHSASLTEITGPDGSISELFKMKSEGLVTAVGLAAGRVDIMMPLLRDWDFDALITHNRFTLVNRNAQPMIDLAVARGTAVLNAAPYAGGVFAKGSQTFKRLAYQDADDETLAPVRKVEAICARFGIPPGAAALQFSLRDKRVTSTICGVSKPERVKETLDWAAFPIPEDAWLELMQVEASTADPEAKRRYAPG